MSKFIGLHNHTSFSILQALPSPLELFKAAKELGQEAIAVTDSGTFAGIWDAFKASKETGVRLIPGGEFYFLNDVADKTPKLRQLVLLAQNAEGYKNILSLNRDGFDSPVTRGRKVLPVIDWSLLAKYSKGVTCLTGCGNGILGQSINSKAFDAAENDGRKLLEIFGKANLGIEVQPNTQVRNPTNYLGGINQIFTNYHLIKLAKSLDLRVVPTCNSRYLKKEQHDVHDVLLAIGAMQPRYSNARLKYNVPDFYLKTADEIKTFFARNFGDDFAEQMLENTIYFANKSEKPDWIDPKFSNPLGKELPVFDVSVVADYAEFSNWRSGQSTEIKLAAEDSAYLRFKCYQVFNRKVRIKLSEKKEQEYVARIEEELSVLDFQGFSSYMLIVADYVQWARDNGITVGPGRGSCGGAIVGYLLGIHKADPIKYGLIFARFQNRERTSPPDIDQDIATSGRGRVIEYLQNKYGQDRVAFISNFSRVTPKVYVRDISRSLEFGGSRQEAVIIGNTIADSISKDFKNASSFSELKGSPLFMEYVSKRHPQIQEYSDILGKVRNFSTHAAALVISKRPLKGLVPIRKDKDQNQAIEYEKNNTEENGLLKLDVLGLSTLDLIDDTLRLINKNYKLNLKSDDINFEEYDKKTYDLISKGDTFGVFQLGTSAGTIDLCKRIQPKSIDDLAIITTLARPAAKNIVDDFIKTREGKRDFSLMHPSLKNAFGKTFGFGLYDESILQLGQDVAGWSMNEADRLRKMIKEKGKNPEKTAKLRQEFIDGATKQGIDRNMGTKIWDEELNKFQGYTFNLAHAVLYSFISYITAYLKAHYPIEFLLSVLMAENLSNAPDSQSNIDRAKLELRKHGVKILPPDINKSEMDYQLLDGKKLLTGLGALKFVGDEAIEDIVAKRPFKDFHDFMVRCDTKKMRSNAIQALAAAGCMDSFGKPRKAIYLYCQDYRKKLQVWLKRHDPNIDTFEFPWSKEPDWSKSELFALEKHYLGEAFICSKKEAFGTFFLDPNHTKLSMVRSSSHKTSFFSVKAEIKSIFEMKVKKEGSKYLGQDMAKCVIEDEFGTQCDLTVFPDTWKLVKNYVKRHSKNRKVAFEPGYAVHFGGSCNLYDNEMGLILNNLRDLVPPPSVPTDMKIKRVAMKSEEPSMTPTSDENPLLQQIEDQLFTEGMVDLNDDEDPFALDI